MTDGYHLPRTDREAHRLAVQAEMLAEATDAVLSAAIPGPIDSALDIGCGTGDVLVELARRAPHARVVGLDLDVGPARARHGDRFELHAGDVFATTPAGAPFDLVFSRFVLHHLPDPIVGLERMWELTRPGGTLVVLDIDRRATTTYPEWTPYTELARSIGKLYDALGLDGFIGHKLPHLCERAGIGIPDGSRAMGLIRRVPELGEFFVLLLEMIHDKLVARGVATADELARLAADLATAPAQDGVYCYRPTTVGVWKRKPA